MYGRFYFTYALVVCDFTKAVGLKQKASLAHSFNSGLEMKMMSLNINGVHQSQKRNAFLAMQMQHKWGVLLPSDTRVHAWTKRNLKTAWKSKQSSARRKGTLNVGGRTAIFFYKEVKAKSYHHNPALVEILALWTACGPGDLFSILSIYAPATTHIVKAFLLTRFVPTSRGIHPRTNASLVEILTLLIVQRLTALEFPLVV